LDLRDKLKNLEPSFKTAQQARPKPVKEDIGRFVDGERIENEFGSYFVASTDYAMSHVHGKVALEAVQDVDSSVYEWVGKDTGLRDLDFRTALFLDTETTGLAGGTGTVPFMIGLGYFRDDVFRIEQYFIEEYKQERAMLQGVYDRLTESKSLVTYNGKCYDMNLLSSRFTLSRMKNPSGSLAHLDLLFTARRLWRKRLQDCSLSNIENQILGFERHGDVPGFMIPSLYFNYLRTGHVGQLANVFDHNRWDIVSLAALTAQAGMIFQNPEDNLEHAEDLFSLGKAFMAMEAFEQAEFCLAHSMLSDLYKSDHYEARRLLGWLYKRQEDWEKAIPLWQEMIRSGVYCIHPYEEIAKYYEHRSGEIALAIEVIKQAIERIHVVQDLKPHLCFESDLRDLEHRLGRLIRKLKE
jgi:uncharacterized protein YprB with RNaseH-like and TPR domain